MRELKINVAGPSLFSKLSTHSYIFTVTLSHWVAFLNKLAFSGSGDNVCCVYNGAFIHLLMNRAKNAN